MGHSGDAYWAHEGQMVGVKGGMDHGSFSRELQSFFAHFSFSQKAKRADRMPTG
jgi:hypothetical protein